MKKKMKPVSGSAVAQCPIPDVKPESEELIAARKLLAKNGYWVVSYRRMWKMFKRRLKVLWWNVTLCYGEICTWIGKKKAEHDAQAEIDRKREAERRVQQEKEASEERARREAEEARRAEILRNEVRLAELKAEEARRQDAARPRPVAESPATVSRPAATVSASRSEGWCAYCGAELVPGARFCRKCGKRVETKPVPSSSVEKSLSPRVEPDKSAVDPNPSEVPNEIGTATVPQGSVAENPVEMRDENAADLKSEE